jgi:tRNA pseudouridine55 synthase
MNSVKIKMKNPKKTKRNVNGILLLDKPTGISSNAALQVVKHLFHAKKAGHTGSLDPLASGMLPICLGEATKYSQYLLTANKTYHVKAKLGIRTTTSDAEGEVVSQRFVKDYTLDELDKACEHFRGETNQIPSMFSALKHQGQPLYKLARQGIVVERPSRLITVFQFNLIDYQDQTLEFQLHCSKGTYVRTIVDDLGELLGCGAHVTFLRRLDVGSLQEKQMCSLPLLKENYDENNPEKLDKFLLPVSLSVAHMPNLQLTDEMLFNFCRGQAIQVPAFPTEGVVAITEKSGAFVGVGEVLEDGKITPKRLCRSNN